MSTQIILTGKVLNGHDLATVKKRFARLHNITLSQAEMYFAGQPQVLKVESDSQKAKNIQTTYTRIGAECILKEFKPKTETHQTSAPILDKISQDFKEIKTSHVSYSPKTEYGTTRMVARILEWTGGIFVILGFISLLLALFQATSLIRVIGGGTSFISGLFLIVSGQIIRAVIDIADSNQEIVSLLKKQDKK